MTYEFIEFSTNANFSIKDQDSLEGYLNPNQTQLYTFIWSKNKPVKLIIDSTPVTLQPHSILALTPIQYLQVIDYNEVVVYQFNREFYCVKDHDQEVSCVGILFFGNTNIPVVTLDDKELLKFESLHNIFIEELETKDNIQAEMLRMLMTRFIIKTTRLLKAKNNYTETPKNSKINLLRTYNFLVEEHFRKEHSVRFYADKLFKSPKTLSNNFAKLNQSPLQIIHNRIILEAKRLLMYSNKTTKQIAFEIGFEDTSHLSRLFKKNTSLSPSEFRKQLKVAS